MAANLSAVTGVLKPLRDVVFVSDMERGARKLSASGLIIPDDDMKESGIRGRCGRVYAVGPEVHEDDIKIGEWIYVLHGRWTNGFDYVTPEGETVKLWQVEYPASVELVSDVNPVTSKAL
jgi:co-chaperonin GroES (HSP10)